MEAKKKGSAGIAEAAVKIRNSFQKVHADLAAEFISGLKRDLEIAEEKDRNRLLCSVDKPRRKRTTQETAAILFKAGLRSPHVRHNAPRRSANIHSYYVGDINHQPSYEQAIAAALAGK